MINEVLKPEAGRHPCSVFKEFLSYDLWMTSSPWASGQGLLSPVARKPCQFNCDILLASPI